MNKRFLCCLALVGILGVVMIAVCLQNVPAAQDAHEVNPSPGRRESPRAVPPVIRLVESPQIFNPTSHERKEELRKAFGVIAGAFSNRQVNVVREVFSAHADELWTLRSDDLRDVLAVPYRVHDDELFQDDGIHRSFRPSRDFSEPGSFESYGKTFLGLVRAIGDVHVARGEYESAMRLEALPLRLLREYREKFASARRREMVDCAESLIAGWIAHIESEQGYSRGYMHWQYSRIVDWYLSEGKSRADAVATARLVSTAELTTFCNYMPKWADELGDPLSKQSN